MSSIHARVVLAISAGLFGGVTVAADIEEIVVTVRKRSEELQELPMTVQSYTAADLEAANITRLADLANATPGVYMESFNAGQATQFTIRGLSAQNAGGFDPQASNNVGRFVDGIYQTSRNNPDIELLDIERVEIVKGPASALYGRSTFGGSINFITRPPPDSFQARVTGTAGTDEDYQGSVMVGGPLADTLRGRLALGASSFDGTFGNVEDPGDNLQGADQATATGSLLWSATDRLDLTLAGFYSDRDQEHSGQYLQTTLNCGTGPTGFTYYCGEPEYRDPVAISPEAFGSESESWQTSITANLELDAVTIVGIAAIAGSDTDVLNDADYTAGGGLQPVCNMPGCSFSPTPVVTRVQAADSFNASDISNDDVSLELRVQSKGDGPLIWLGGLFFFQSDADVALGIGVDNSGLAAGEFFVGALPALTATPDPVNRPVEFTRFSSEVETYAAFGSIGYQFTERLGATLELRWEHEKKTFDSMLNFFAPGAGEISEDWDFLTPRFTLDYQATDDILVFGSVAQGVHSGGFNSSYPTAFPDEATYDEEDNWTYEIGAKSEWLDRRLTANASVFYVEWDDMQIAGRSASPTFVGSIVRNTGSADDVGVDLQLVAAPADWVTLGLGYTYSKAEFDSGVHDRGALFACAPDICTITPDGADVGGKRLPRSPENQLSAYAAFNGEFAGGWAWSFRTDVNYVDDVYRETINTIQYGERTLVNARLSAERGPWTLALWGRNIFDDEYITAGAFQPRTFTARAIDWTQGEGARAGITVSYDFR